MRVTDARAEQGRTEDCIGECGKALELKGANVKALFRRGKVPPPGPRGSGSAGSGRLSRIGQAVARCLG